MSELISQFTFRKGDLNGFVQLFFDNLATLLALIFFLQDTLRGFNSRVINENIAGPFGSEIEPLNTYIDEIIYQRTVPGLAATMVFGNIYYTFMGARLGRDEDRHGDVTALPYGVNTPGAFAFLFSIIGPAASIAGAKCSQINITSSESAVEYRVCLEGAGDAAWRAGVVSNFVAGIVSIALGLGGRYVLKAAPAVALLSALAGIGLAFLGIAQVAQNYAEPLAGLVPLWLTVVAFFGNVSFGPMPKSLLVALVGIALGWMDGLRTGAIVDASTNKLQFWGVDTGFRALGDWSSVGDYIGTTIPVALAAAAQTLMNVLSAENAGDKYGISETMISDGVGTVVGALFGTPFGTSVYIGHPGYKKMGAGIVYSLINCSLFFIFAIFGVFALINALVPTTAVSPLIFFVGIMICQEAIAAAPVRQIPAFFIGILPSLMDWASGAGMDLDSVGGHHYYGLLSMAKGSLLLALVSASLAIFVIERDFLTAALWAFGAGVMSAFGLIHQDAVKLKDWTDPQGLYCRTPRLPDQTCPEGYTECLYQGFQPMCATNSTVKWRFMVGYFLVAAMLAIFYVLQRMGKVEAKVEDEIHEEEEAETGKSWTHRLSKSVDNPKFDGAKTGTV